MSFIPSFIRLNIEDNVWIKFGDIYIFYHIFISYNSMFLFLPCFCFFFYFD